MRVIVQMEQLFLVPGRMLVTMLHLHQALWDCGQKLSLMHRLLHLAIVGRVTIPRIQWQGNSGEFLIMETLTAIGTQVFFESVLLRPIT